MIKIEIICNGRPLKPYQVRDPLGYRTVVGLKKGEDYAIRLCNTSTKPVTARVFHDDREQIPGTLGIYPWRLAPRERKVIPPSHRFWHASKISTRVSWHRLYDPKTVAVELWPWEALRAKLREDNPDVSSFSRFC